MTWKLNMGCGDKPLADHVNADSIHLPGVTLVCDFSRKPWPFKDNSFLQIQAINVLEHLPNTLSSMEEIWRVCKDGATIHIRVPHFKSHNAFKDPTHKSYFTEDSFEYFSRGKISWYSHARFDILKVTKVYQYHVDKYIRRPFPRLLRFVEKFFHNTIEAIEFDLRAVKQPKHT